MNKNLPRGIRNNNPLNIRIGNDWYGEVANPTDREFEQFVNMACGLRAAFMLLKRYIQRYHLDNITEIISRWAPANENNTKKYIERVSVLMGISPLQEIKFESHFQMVSLVNAMVQVECGCEINVQLICEAYWNVYNNILPDKTPKVYEL